MAAFSRNIRPSVDAALHLARDAMINRRPAEAFAHLEQAHVLGQMSTLHHVRAHWAMLRWGFQQGQIKEIMGQLFRLLGAATKTPIGLLPHGNTGGAKVSPFKPMPIPTELAEKIKAAQQS